MPIFADADHLWGQDLAVSPTGDIALVTAALRTQQRIVRRLLTNSTVLGSSDYPWEPTYGAGLPSRIGETLDTRSIQAVVISQMLQEASVARTPAPKVTVSAMANGVVSIDVLYFDNSGNPLTFGFNLTNLTGA